MAEFSRRRLTGSLAALPFIFSELRAQNTVPTENDPNGHLTIAVEINGRGPFQFVVDTGADTSVLADTTASALQLPLTGAMLLAGIVRTVQATAVTVDTIRFGSFTHQRLTLPVLQQSLLMSDGYLGLDVLDGNRVIIDFAQRQFIVADSLPTLLSVYPGAEVVVLHAQGSGGHLRTTTCKIDHQQVAAFVDTGAQFTMGNGALYRALLASDPSYAAKKYVTLTGLTGGVATGLVTTPRQVQLGRFVLTDCPIAIADLQVFGLWGLTEQPALVIGMNWLRHFKRVEVDYGRKDLRFEVGYNTFNARGAA